MEALVHQQRHHLDVALARELEDATVNAPPEDAEAVDAVAADAEDVDAIGVLDEALVAVLAIYIIEKALESRLGLEGQWKEAGEVEQGTHRGVLGGNRIADTRC
jgi:hypothetical protein